MLLGGRTAEEIAFGEISTGAQNDLQRATDIARAMVTEFGMSDALGAINYDGNKRAALPRHADAAGARHLRRGDGAEDRRRDQAHPRRTRTTKRARILSEHREMLEELSHRLLESRK